MAYQSFTEWAANHGHDLNTAWHLQNMLLSCLGEDHPLTTQATRAWLDKRRTNGNKTDLPQAQNENP